MNDPYTAMETEVVGVKAAEPEFETDFDRSMNEFAKAIGQASRGNAEFKALMHEEALAKFDGDFDVLLANVASKQVTPTDPALVTRSGGGQMSVGELLDSYFPPEAKTRA